MKEYFSGILEKVRSYCSCCFILPLLSVCAPNRAIMCYNVVVTSYKLNIYASVKLVSTPLQIFTVNTFLMKGAPGASSSAQVKCLVSTAK